jgi:Arc/MetJ-type ribon-helix-helix transcriptional regulator
VEKDQAAKSPAAKKPAEQKPVEEKAAGRAAGKAVAETVVEPAKKAEAEGGRKEKREKVVRDSFSIPKSEHAQLKVLRTELAKAGRLASKSEVLRAGLRLLAERSGAELASLIGALPAVPKGKGKK